MFRCLFFFPVPRGREEEDEAFVGVSAALSDIAKGPIAINMRRSAHFNADCKGWTSIHKLVAHIFDLASMKAACDKHSDSEKNPLRPDTQTF